MSLRRRQRSIFWKPGARPINRFTGAPLSGLGVSKDIIWRIPSEVQEWSMGASGVLILRAPCYPEPQEDTLKSYVFKVVVEDDEFEDGRKAFSAYRPDLPGALTWGTTREEALEKLKEAIQFVIETLQQQGKEIPPEAILAETESPAVVVTV